MSLDRYTNVLSFRRGGTIYTYHGYTTTEGGTRYLAVRKGGVVRYLPFTTSGTEPLKMRWDNTTYTLVRPSSKIVVSYSVTATKSFASLYVYKVDSISATSNRGFTENWDINVSIKTNASQNAGQTASTAMFLGAGSKSVTGASTGKVIGTSWTLTISVGSGGQGTVQTDSGTRSKSDARTWTYT